MQDAVHEKSRVSFDYWKRPINCHSVLQCIAVCCSVLQCVAVYRSVLKVSFDYRKSLYIWSKETIYFVKRALRSTECTVCVCDVEGLV